jgi:hypothetical protein
VILNSPSRPTVPLLGVVADHELAGLGDRDLPGVALAVVVVEAQRPWHGSLSSQALEDRVLVFEPSAEAILEVGVGAASRDVGVDRFANRL